MKKRIVTISREFGSGGHTIGKTVAAELGIAFYDQELLEINTFTDAGKSVILAEVQKEVSEHKDPVWPHVVSPHFC